MEVERLAAMEILDAEHQPLPQSREDTNIYNLGSVNNHNIIIAGLPKPGNCSAALHQSDEDSIPEPSNTVYW